MKDESVVMLQVMYAKQNYIQHNNREPNAILLPKMYVDMLGCDYILGMEIMPTMDLDVICFTKVE